MFFEFCVHEGQASVRQAMLSGDSSCFSPLSFLFSFSRPPRGVGVVLCKTSDHNLSSVKMSS